MITVEQLERLATFDARGQPSAVVPGVRRGPDGPGRRGGAGERGRLENVHGRAATRLREEGGGLGALLRFRVG